MGSLRCESDERILRRALRRFLRGARLQPPSAQSAGPQDAGQRHCLGHASPELRRVRGIVPEMATGLWVLTHEDLRRMARIRTVMEPPLPDLWKTEDLAGASELAIYCSTAFRHLGRTKAGHARQDLGTKYLRALTRCPTSACQVL